MGRHQGGPSSWELVWRCQLTLKSWAGRMGGQHWGGTQEQGNEDAR